MQLFITITDEKESLCVGLGHIGLHRQAVELISYGETGDVVTINIALIKLPQITNQRNEKDQAQ